MNRIYHSLTLIALFGAVSSGQEAPATKATRPPALSDPVAGTESNDAHLIASKLDAVLARPVQELAVDGMKLGAEILAELDHGGDLARLEERGSYLEQRLETLRKSLAETQAASKLIKQELTTRSTEITERYDDEDVRDRLLQRLVVDIKPQLVELKTNTGILESDAKAVMERLAELRVLLAERQFTRDQATRSFRSTERRRNVSIGQLEKILSPLPKLKIVRKTPPMETGSSKTHTNPPAGPVRSAREQLKELEDL